jgi:hypothetical protein
MRALATEDARAVALSTRDAWHISQVDNLPKPCHHNVYGTGASPNAIGEQAS